MKRSKDTGEFIVQILEHFHVQTIIQHRLLSIFGGYDIASSQHILPISIFFLHACFMNDIELGEYFERFAATRGIALITAYKV